MTFNTLKQILALFLLLLISVPSYAEVKVYLNQALFYEGDPITLKIETSQDSDIEPELSVLKKDFNILGVRKSSQRFSVNGKRSFLQTWAIELQANKNGALQIPPIVVGQEKTQRLNFTINDLPPEVTAETNKHIFIETNVGTEGSKTFVQQQIPYTVKLFYDDTIQTAEIITPEIDNTILEKLGKNKRYRVTKAGKQFNVIEKRFVISPEKSGPLHIPALMVKGRIALSGGDSPALRQKMDETDMLNRFFNDFRNDPFFQDSFGGGFFTRRSQGPSKPFSIKGKAIEVDVLPVPKAFTGKSWLPAEDLIIKDSWTLKPPELKEGEPVTRSLTLQAKGLAGSQIPDISIPKPKNMKVYPDKAKSETATDGNTVYGIQQINITYIPNHSGKVNIPEIKVDWWDVKNKKQETFILPAWNLNILPDLAKMAEEKIAPNTIMEEGQLPPASISVEKKDDATTDKAPASPDSDSFGTWKLIMLPLLLLLLGVLFYVLRKYLDHKQKSQQQTSPSRYDISNLRTALLQACKNNDKQSAAKNLLKFAQVYWDDDSLQYLGMIASRLEQKSDSKIIKDLEQSLYRLKTKDWNGEALLRLIERGLQQKQEVQQQETDGLTPLYPS